MSTLYWIGGAPAVAQVWTASIDTVDGTPANNDFIVTIGTESVSTTGDTDVTTTATALAVALNASTHPYFAAITWTSSVGDIIGTADVLGSPFIAALTETGAGSATVTDFAETTANAGPNSAATPGNYSSGALPVATDILVVKDNAVPIAYDLEALTAVTLAVFRHDLSATGAVGLVATSFATEVDGTVSDVTIVGAAPLASVVAEYRPRYLKIGWDAAELGQHLGPGSPAGTPRLKLNNPKAGASDTTVYGTNANGESQRPAVMLLAAHASADFSVRACPGGVGFAVDVPGETATIGDLNILTPNGSNQVILERGVTYTSITQDGGTASVVSAVAATTHTINGGLLIDDGQHAVTTVTVNGGTAVLNNKPAAGDAVVTLNVEDGGEVDLQQSNIARTFTTVNWNGGSILDNAAVTKTTLNLPTRKSVLTAVSA
jgi:hypothetical protein